MKYYKCYFPKEWLYPNVFEDENKGVVRLNEDGSIPREDINKIFNFEQYFAVDKNEHIFNAKERRELDKLNKEIKRR